MYRPLNLLLQTNIIPKIAEISEAEVTCELLESWMMVRVGVSSDVAVVLGTFAVVVSRSVEVRLTSSS